MGVNKVVQTHKRKTDPKRGKTSVVICFLLSSYLESNSDAAIEDSDINDNIRNLNLPTSVAQHYMFSYFGVRGRGGGIMRFVAVRYTG
jgi:hypothetical protein